MIFQDKQRIPIRQALAGLQNQGYQLEFRRESTCIFCFELREQISPDDFMVDESYYFEDRVNPGSDRILYAISLNDGRKGFLIDACNVYADNISYEMEQKLGWQYPAFS